MAAVADSIRGNKDLLGELIEEKDKRIHALESELTFLFFVVGLRSSRP